jgi:Domain of unknown function (DUF4166)
VDIHIPNGLAGILGRRFAKKLGIPVAGIQHHLQVEISHHTDGLHWDRCFDDAIYVRSIFRPVGAWPHGYWIEDTGPLQLQLTVDVREGGWHWRCIQLRAFGWRFPLWLFPHSHAFKTIEAGRYKFFVGFSLPWLGTILSYSGLLVAKS